MPPVIVFVRACVRVRVSEINHDFPAPEAYIDTAVTAYTVSFSSVSYNILRRQVGTTAQHSRLFRRLRRSFVRKNNNNNKKNSLLVLSGTRADATYKSHLQTAANRW